MFHRYRVAVVQLNSGEDKSANLEKAGVQLARAAATGAALIVLPEMFNGFGRWETMTAAAEPIPGATHDWLAEQARRHRVWLVGGSICEREPGESRCHNTSLLFDPEGRLAGKYRKIHLFDADVPGQPTARESHWMAGGREPTTTDTPLGQLSQAICYDLRFSALFEHYAMAGSELIVVPAAFTATTGRAHWEVLLRARAIECQAYVIAANQVGPHPGTFSTYGHSLIIDPWGTVLADAGESVGIAYADIDIEQLRAIRRRIPTQAHRRPIGRR